MSRKDVVAYLNDEIENLTRLRDWFEGRGETHIPASGPEPSPTPGRRGRRPGPRKNRISAAGRKKISEMMKKRWAERRKLAAKGK